MYVVVGGELRLRSRHRLFIMTLISVTLFLGKQRHSFLLCCALTSFSFVDNNTVLSDNTVKSYLLTSSDQTMNCPGPRVDVVDAFAHAIVMATSPFQRAVESDGSPWVVPQVQEIVVKSVPYLHRFRKCKGFLYPTSPHQPAPLPPP